MSLAFVVFLIIVALCGLPTRSRFVGRLAIRIRNEWSLLSQELQQRKTRLPFAIVLHFVAWAMGGAQLWMGGQALGIHIGLFQSIVMESVAYAGRAVLAFIPAGLAMQEGALIVGGLLFGFRPDQSLALALLFRLRDIVFGLPLAFWPVFERRRKRRVDGSPDLQCP
jgi:uncharacterized membrane protein YbhN (UPF0104 family)